MDEFLLGKGTITKGAICGQDFSFFKWPREQDMATRIFEFYGNSSDDRVKAVAHTYGLNPGTDSYGNGAIYVSALEIELLPKEQKMDEPYKNAFDFVVKFKGNWLSLYRRNKTSCVCPFNDNEHTCSSMCPHFIVENCSIVDKRCQLILTCGKNISRLVEIIE